jgi:hypothetical protein
MPPHGYGAGRLCGVKRTLASEQIVQVMLGDWLRANGYLRTGGAVERTIDAAVATSADRDHFSVNARGH